MDLGPRGIGPTRFGVGEVQRVAGQADVGGPDIRAAAVFKLHNLLEPLEGEPFDCIFIKNVLIYFDEESKRRAVRHLLDSLGKGGYLVVGPTEGIYGMLGSLTKQKTWLFQKPA